MSSNYITSLESIISETFIPIWYKYYGLVNKKPPTLELNQRLLEAKRNIRQTPRLFLPKTLWSAE